MPTRIKAIILGLGLTLPGINPGIAVHAADTAPRQGFDLGEEATAQQIRDYGRTIYPDGQGLPQGSGGVRAGRALYQQHCLRCHGAGGLGGTADQLAKASQGLRDANPEKTIGTFWPSAVTLFDFIQRSMPMENPGSLSNEESYALTAYLLYLNELLEEEESLDAQALSRIRMPNREGFLDSWKPHPQNPADEKAPAR